MFKYILFILCILVTINVLFALDSENIICDSRTWLAWDKGMDVAIQDDYAYIAGGYAGLAIIDISQPESLVVACDYDESHIFTNSIHLTEGVAYIGAREDGLWIVDISDPGAPEELSLIDTDNYVNDVAVFGDIAYLACMEGGLKVVDVSDPENPEILRSCFDNYLISQVFCEENCLYLVNPYPEYNCSLVLIVSLNNPEFPQEFGAFYVRYIIEDVCIKDDYAYISPVEGRDNNHGTAFFSVYNIRDKRNPRFVRNCQTSFALRGITVSGDYLYTATGCLSHYGDSDNRDYACWGEVDIFNISDSSNPEQVCHFETGRTIRDVAVKDSIACIITGDFGRIMKTINVANPEEPVLLNWIGHKYYKEYPGIFISNNYAYLSYSRDPGLWIFDISDKLAPQLVSCCDTLYIDDLIVSGDYAYAIHNGILIMDVSNPTEPEIINNIDIEGRERALFIQDSIAYVISMSSWSFSEGTLQLFDISDPENPDSLGSCTLQEGDDDWVITVSDGYAYVIEHMHNAYNSKMRIVDVSNPLHPYTVNEWEPEPETALHDIQVSGDYVYIVTGEHNDGLYILDVADKDSIKQTGYFEIKDCNGVFIDGDYTYVSAGYFFDDHLNSGISVIDISDPANPVRVGYALTPGNATDIVFADGYIYVADQTNLGIYHFVNPDAVEDPFIHQPSEFILYPAYPNPFNSSVTITYSLPMPSHVSLGIYNLQGRKVVELVQMDWKGTGWHSVGWNGSKSPNGLYWVVLNATDQKIVQPILLVK